MKITDPQILAYIRSQRCLGSGRPGLPIQGFVLESEKNKRRCPVCDQTIGVYSNGNLRIHSK